VVRLDSGTTVRRQLIGIDPSTYQAVREGQANDEQLLLVRAARITNLVATRRADSLAYVRQAAELRASHLDVAALNAELTKQEVRTRQALATPPGPPLLLDRHTYTGAGGGALLLLLLNLFILH
jgi:hypothetical protein